MRDKSQSVLANGSDRCADSSRAEMLRAEMCGRHRCGRIVVRENIAIELHVATLDEGPRFVEVLRTRPCASAISVSRAQLLLIHTRTHLFCMTCSCMTCWHTPFSLSSGSTGAFVCLLTMEISSSGATAPRPNCTVLPMLAPLAHPSRWQDTQEQPRAYFSFRNAANEDHNPSPLSRAASFRSPVTSSQ